MLQKGGARIDPAAIRCSILGMAYRANTPHIACALSIVEIFASLYNHFLNFNRLNPEDCERDYLILSKGHGVMTQYACHRELGWITQEQLDRYGTDGSFLHGLCEFKVPGCEVSSGSLGHGLPVAAGIALGLKRSEQGHRKVYCIVGDGEMNEGSIWESLLFAGHHKLDNLVVIVDSNGFQAMGKTHEILDLEPFRAKLEAFGFVVLECDGHSDSELKSCLNELTSRLESKKPRALIANTVKGKGISFMEANNTWHYARLSAELFEQALHEIKRI